VVLCPRRIDWLEGDALSVKSAGAEAIGAVWSDVAELEPTVLLAVTTTWIVLPTSLLVSGYDVPVTPVSLHVGVHRCQL
jgi:hypothetical protein